jgi:chromosome segregation ATPase
MTKGKKQADASAVERVAATPIIDQMRTEQVARLDAAEGLLLVLADSDAERPHVGADRELAFQSLGWDRDRIRKEIGRCRKFLHWKRIAGTLADRAAARNRRESARQQLEERGPTIIREMERLRALEAELANLRSAVEIADGDVRNRELALTRAAEALPEYVRNAYDQRKEEIEREMKSEANPISAQIELAEKLIRVNVGDVSDVGFALDYLEDSHPELLNPSPSAVFGGVRKPIDQSRSARLNKARFQEYQQQLIRDLPMLREKLQQIHSCFNERLAAVDAELLERASIATG